MRALMAVALVVGAGCSPSKASDACVFATGELCSGPQSANRGCPGGACNWCDCGPGWGGDVAICTEVACGPAVPCQSQADCSGGSACVFKAGCGETAGVCNNQTFYCPHNPYTFTLCDCDGNTVEDSVNSCAPDRRYAHVGACP